MVSLLDTELRDDRFYPPSPEFCLESPAAIGVVYGKIRWTRAISDILAMALVVCLISADRNPTETMIVCDQVDLAAKTTE